MPHFFLSYARDDKRDGYLDKFYEDLCEAVRLKTGAKYDEVGFRDESNLEIGSDWPTGLADGIASARTFVAICSPSYFSSEMCGREWQLFLEIDRARRQEQTSRPPALLPITWVPSDDLPEVARRVQHSHADLGQVYREEGLHFLLRLTRNRDDYETFLVRFAQRIAAGGSHPPPPSPVVPNLESTPSAFLRNPTVTDADRARVESHALGPSLPEKNPDQAPGGPRHVTFVIVAGSLDEVGQVRHDTRYYGQTAYDWTPFHQSSSEPICVTAQGVAYKIEMISKPALATTSIVDLLQRAQERNEVLVLVVDVWTTQLPAYLAVLVEYDGRTSTCPILVPWNHLDSELQASSKARLADLKRAFPNNSKPRNALFHTKIPTTEKFRAVLEEVLAIAQSEIFRYSPVARRAGNGRPTTRPILSE